jgi:hypothetical protein
LAAISPDIFAPQWHRAGVFTAKDAKGAKNETPAIAN